jgi:hypothetical protein
MVLVLHGGELAQDIAERIASEGAAQGEADIACHSMETFKKLKLTETTNTVVFGTGQSTAAPRLALPPPPSNIHWALSTHHLLIAPPPTTTAVLQTIENNEPPEVAGSCVRFFKRKSHAADLLSGKLRFTVLAVGDSNLLLDRQTTGAKDCNKCGQLLDARLEELGGERFYGYAAVVAACRPPGGQTHGRRRPRTASWLAGCVRPTHAACGAWRPCLTTDMLHARLLPCHHRTRHV